MLFDTHPLRPEHQAKASRSLEQGEGNERGLRRNTSTQNKEDEVRWSREEQWCDAGEEEGGGVASVRGGDGLRGAR